MFSGDIINSFLVMGAVQGLAMAVILMVISNRNQQPRILVAIILLFLAIGILTHIIFHTDYQQISNSHEMLPFKGLNFSLFFFTLGLSFGPLIYLYLKSLTFVNFKFELVRLYHFLPAFLCFLFFVLQKTEIHQYANITSLAQILEWIVIAHVGMYLILASITIYKAYNANDLSRNRIIIIQFFIISSLSIWVSALFSESVNGGSDSWTLIWLLVSVIIYAICLLAFVNSEFFQLLRYGKLVLKRVPINKYNKSTLPEIRAPEYLKKLDDVMNTKKLHMRSDLTLQQIANELAISHHHLSQIINQKLRQNFYELVNRKRIEEAKLKLGDLKYSNSRISDIAFDVGFISLTSFNNAFKKYTDTTPSQFRKKISSK